MYADLCRTGPVVSSLLCFLKSPYRVICRFKQTCVSTQRYCKNTHVAQGLLCHLCFAFGQCQSEHTCTCEFVYTSTCVYV